MLVLSSPVTAHRIRLKNSNRWFLWNSIFINAGESTWIIHFVMSLGAPRLEERLYYVSRSSSVYTWKIRISFHSNGRLVAPLLIIHLFWSTEWQPWLRVFVTQLIPRGKFRIISHFRPKPIFSISFQIHHSSIIVSLDNTSLSHYQRH